MWALDTVMSTGSSKENPMTGESSPVRGTLLDSMLVLLSFRFYTATSSSTSLANRFLATCKRRLIVPIGASNASLISVSD